MYKVTRKAVRSSPMTRSTPEGSRSRSSTKPGHETRSRTNDSPDDGPNQIFIVRAIDQIGRSRFKADWAPELANAPTPKAIPNWSASFADNANMRVLESVAEIVRSIDPKLVPADDMSKGGSSIDDDWASNAECWNAAVKARSAYITAIDAAKARVGDVFVSLIEDLRRGQLTTYLRPVAGGEYVVAEPSIWNFEGWRERFTDGLVAAAKPYASLRRFDSWDDRIVGATHFMFLSREELRRSENIEAETPALDKLWPHLSPYMRIAIQEAAVIVFEGEEPKGEDLKHRLKTRAAALNIELSLNLVNGMNTMIRSVEAGQGRRQKKL